MATAVIFFVNLLHVYIMRAFLRNAFLGKNCAYYTHYFTVIY